MARYLFVSWSGAGNQPPAVAIAQALQRRGHHVTFAGYESQRDYFRTRGFRFMLLERASAAWRDEPRDRMPAVKLNAVWASSEHLHDLPDLVCQERCEVLIVDCLMFGALAILEKAGIPTAVLVHSAPGALMPPRGQFEALLLEPINRVRRAAGCVEVGSLWEAWARFPALCTSIRELDPLGSDTPASFSYLGPIFEEVARSDWLSPWSADDLRPLVLVSFSTGPYWDQGPRIRKTLEALAHVHCRVLATTGITNLNEISIPSNAVVARHVLHTVVLPSVSLTVTHAGHGTVAASLRHGVPMLCLPNPVADQPILARQVQNLGAGLALEGDTATVGEIRDAAERILTDKSYSGQARELAVAIDRSPGVLGAVCKLESLAMAGGAERRADEG